MRKALVLYFVLLFASVVCADYLLNRRLAFQAAPPAGDTMVTNGLIVRYWLDEAASGTSPTTLEDDGHGTDMDLTLTYDGTMVWTNTGTDQRGLHLENESGNQRAEWIDGGATNLVAGDKLYDELDGSQTATLEIVASFNGFSSGGGRVFHIDDNAGANGEFTMRCSTSEGTTDLEWYVHNDTDGETIQGNFDVGSGQRIVYHWILDSTQAAVADRVKIYTNGVQATDSDPAFTQNAAINFDATETFLLMNRQSGSSYARSFSGVLHYAACYDIAFDSNQVTTNYNRLISDDDAP